MKVEIFVGHQSVKEVWLIKMPPATSYYGILSRFTAPTSSHSLGLPTPTFLPNAGAAAAAAGDMFVSCISRRSLSTSHNFFNSSPEAKDMFYFLKSSEDAPQNNQKLKTHALVLFKLTCNSAIRLQEEGDIAVPDDALRRLGSIHLERGVKDSHFEVMREALLTTVREAAGDHWSDGLGMAWAVAYDKLAFEIKRKMKE